MTSGCCCRHLVHGIILTFCLSFAIGVGEATPSNQEFDFNDFLGKLVPHSCLFYILFTIILGFSAMCSSLEFLHVMICARCTRSLQSQSNWSVHF